jgi:hypothetical protein
MVREITGFGRNTRARVDSPTLALPLSTMLPMISVLATDMRSSEVFPQEVIKEMKIVFFERAPFYHFGKLINALYYQIRTNNQINQRKIVWKTKNHVSVSLSANAA